jgi:hypothetical protein
MTLSVQGATIDVLPVPLPPRKTTLRARAAMGGGDGRRRAQGGGEDENLNAILAGVYILE